jgi:hypothetical protein
MIANMELTPNQSYEDYRHVSICPFYRHLDRFLTILNFVTPFGNYIWNCIYPLDYRAYVTAARLPIFIHEAVVYLRTAKRLPTYLVSKSVRKIDFSARVDPDGFITLYCNQMRYVISADFVEFRATGRNGQKIEEMVIKWRVTDDMCFVPVSM